MSFHVDQGSVKALKAPENGHSKVWYDDKLAGFGVRVTESGVKAFIFNYYVAGRERRLTIGRFSSEEWSAKAARAEAGRLRVLVDLGNDPKEEQEAKKKEREIALAEKTVAELSDIYIREYAMKNNRPKSVQGDQRMLAKIVLPKLGKLKVSADVKHEIELLHASLKKTKYQANRVLSLLSGMFNFAVDHKLRADNPCRGIKRFREDRRESWLQSDELHAVAEALDNYSDQSAANAVRLLILTGSRPHEVMGAEWPMFDLQRGFWNKPSHHVKQKKDEHMPLSDPALAILRRMFQDRKNDTYLFPNSKGDGPRERARNCWRAVCRDAGLATMTQQMGRRGKLVECWTPKYRLYDLRHSFASVLINRGASLYLVGKLMGHTQPATTTRYAHCADGALREVANAFPDVLSQRKLAG